MWRLALILAVGCGRHLNPEWCALPGHSDPACGAPVDAARNAAPDAAPDAAPGAAPDATVDAPSGACAVDDDCAAAVCLPTGACADPGAVLFVAPSGVGTACTVGQRCLLATAIAQATPDRSIIALAPATYTGVVTIDHTVQIVGRDATLEAASGDAVTVTGGVAAELDFVAITGATGRTGLTCQAGATLRAHAISVSGAQQGVASACALTLERSTVRANTDGGIVITAGSVDIHDSFIILNGSDGAGVAAVSIAAGVTGSFAFNTVAYNNAKQNADPGVRCSSTQVIGPGNLVTDNTHKGSFGVTPQVAGTCDFTGSYTAAGAGGNDMHWVDVNAGSAGFHLTAASTEALDKLACAAGVDFDGDPRPIGSGCDYGADELRP